MTLGNAINSFMSNSICFVEPVVWKDNYESRFYTCSYGPTCINQIVDTPKLYASCFTKNKVSEAAWYIYSHKYSGLDSICVMVEIDLNNFRKSLSKAIGSKDIVYEGAINYQLSQSMLDTLHLPNNRLHNLFANNFSLKNYLNLLLLKRPFFSYENEVRFFINKYNDNNKTSNANATPLIVQNINWALFIKSITIHSRIDSVEYKILEQICKNNNIKTNIKTNKPENWEFSE